MAGALLWPLSAATAAISYAVYKRAKRASASVPERYIKVSSVFPEEYDDATRPTDIYLLFVSLEECMEKSKNNCRHLSSIHLCL